MGRPLSAHERQTQAPGLLLARLDGQCDGPVRWGADGIPPPSGRVPLGRWRLRHADGRPAYPESIFPSRESRGLQQRCAGLHRDRAEVLGLHQHRHGAEQPELRSRGERRRYTRDPTGGSGRSRRGDRRRHGPRGPGVDRCGRESHGARDAALDHGRNGQGFLTLYGQGDPQRSRQRSDRSGQNEFVALIARRVEVELERHRLARKRVSPNVHARGVGCVAAQRRLVRTISVALPISSGDRNEQGDQDKQGNGSWFGRDHRRGAFGAQPTSVAVVGSVAYVSLYTANAITVVDLSGGASDAATSRPPPRRARWFTMPRTISSSSRTTRASVLSPTRSTRTAPGPR